MTKRKLGEPHRYELEKSPLHGLSNKKKLASLIGSDVTKISRPDESGLTQSYRIFVDKNTLRFITEPIGDLALIHRRLMKLFCRIAPPNYIHSAIKKRSYKTNAIEHKDGVNILKIDIKKFFPSIKYSFVHRFFARTLNCAPDIATILTKLCVVKTEKYGMHLPTGSCISPILSFLVNRSLFDSINSLCCKQGCKLTLYVDDITISGENASSDLLNQVASEIYNHGYNYHKIKIYRNTPAVITGLVVDDGKISLPFERVGKIRELRKTLRISTGPLRKKLLASLVGRLSEAEHIDKRFKAIRCRVIESNKADWDDVVFSRKIKSRNARLRKNLAL